MASRMSSPGKKEEREISRVLNLKLSIAEEYRFLIGRRKES